MGIIGKGDKLKAGHYEIQGESIAKFEFFDNGFNPYSRYLDVDKVDLILRKREKKAIRYIEVQVKYGRLYNCGPKWQKKLFDVTAWKMFKISEFQDTRKDLFIVFVFSHPDFGYRGDMFIFPSAFLNELIKVGIHVNTKKGKQCKVYIARSKDNKWYFLKKAKFDEISNITTTDVTNHRRNFNILEQSHD